MKRHRAGAKEQTWTLNGQDCRSEGRASIIEQDVLINSVPLVSCSCQPVLWKTRGFRTGNAEQPAWPYPAPDLQCQDRTVANRQPGLWKAGAVAVPSLARATAGGAPSETSGQDGGAKLGVRCA